jgi:hypothetical protein
MKALLEAYCTTETETVLQEDRTGGGPMFKFVRPVPGSKVPYSWVPVGGWVPGERSGACAKYQLAHPQTQVRSPSPSACLREKGRER